MAYTKQQIADYARQLGSKGASAEEIEAFVASASKDVVQGEQAQPSRANVRTILDPMGNPLTIDNESGEVIGSREAAGVAGLGADSGAEGGGAVAGQLVGAALGGRLGAPGIGAALGRMTGGTIGNLLGQGRRVATGEQQGYSGGQSVGAAIGSLVPGAKQAAAGIGTVLKEAGSNVASNVAAANAESLVDKGKLAGIGQNILAALTPAIGSIVGYRSRGKISRPARNDEMSDMERVLAQNNETVRSMREFELPNADGSTARAVVDPASLKNDDNTLLKSLGGSAALGQEASIRNVRVFQGATREQLGLGKDARPFTPLRENGRFKGWAELEQIRADAAKPYEEIARNRAAAQERLDKIASRLNSPEGATEKVFDQKTGRWAPKPEIQEEIDRLSAIAAADVDALKVARKEAIEQYKRVKANIPEAYDSWQAAIQRAEQLEDAVEAAGRASGKPELADQLSAARKRIAETYVAESAINPGNGLVDPEDFARVLDARPNYMTGNMEKIARFRRAMPKDAVEFSKIGDPNSNAMTQQLMTSAGLNNPKTAILGQGVPLLRKHARNRLLSDELQDAMLGQRLERMKEGLTQETLRRSLMAASRSGE